ncbi:MAG: UxaA family hydrolase [Oscillospiraceae bacterium]|jgi:altronate dehydratase small subunit
MPRAILVNAKDNVAVLVEPAKQGETVCVDRDGQSPLELVAARDIPVYHKMALMEIKKGASVVKYGEEIGVATADIAQGSHVHVHNVESRAMQER